MIYPRKNRLKRWILDAFISRSVKKHFHAVKIYGVAVDADKPVLLIANHFSYWDGMLLYNNNLQITGKQFHVMLLEDTAKQHSMLTYGGAFSVNKGSRNVLASINFAAGLLNVSHNMVLIFPQGKLYSNFTDIVRFEKGVLKIIAQAPKNYQLLMAATFVENFRHQKPVASIYLKQSTQTQFINIAELERVYQEHYTEAKQKHIEKAV